MRKTKAVTPKEISPRNRLIDYKRIGSLPFWMLLRVALLAVAVLLMVRNAKGDGPVYLGYTQDVHAAVGQSNAIIAGKIVAMEPGKAGESGGQLAHLQFVSANLNGALWPQKDGLLLGTLIGDPPYASSIVIPAAAPGEAAPQVGGRYIFFTVSDLRAQDHTYTAFKILPGDVIGLERMNHYISELGANANAARAAELNRNAAQHH